MHTRRSVIIALSGAFSCALTLPGFGARADYPSGPIKIIVSFPAGGSIDVIMRAMAAPLQARLGKPIVIENRAGAAGVVAEGAVAKADPDGLTLLADASALAANPTLFKSMPFDTLKDLQPVYLVFRTPLALVVNPEVPAKSIKELIALLKEKPGQINFAHGGPGSAIHLAGELFQIMTDTTMTGVAYRGAPLALNDVIAGRVALMFADAGSVSGQIKAGRVRALGVSSTVRVPALAGYSDHCRSRRARFRGCWLDAGLRACSDAEANPRHAQCRVCRRGRNARSPCPYAATRHAAGEKRVAG